MSKNCKVELTGNLGKDAKTITSEKGTEFVALSVATTDSYKDKNGKWQQKEPLWHEVRVFRPNAINFAKDLKKGDRVNVKGSLSYRHVEGKEGYQIPQASVVASFIAKQPLPDKDNEDGAE